MIKRIIKFFLIFILMLVIFICLLTISSNFPSIWIKENVKKSANTLVEEGNRKFVYAFENFQFVQFDNYSDALMINTAYSIDSSTPLYSAFTAKKDYIPGKTKFILRDVVGELHSSSKYKFHDEVSELNDTVNGEAPESFEYAKYWHGYLVLLRPLLLIFDYWRIRILLMAIFAILAIWLVNLIASKINKSVAMIYLLSLLEIEYFYIGLSLLNSIMLLIMMTFSIYLIKRFEKIKDFCLFFFVLGIVIGFFGLLDIPLLVFGGVLIIYFLCKNKFKNATVKENITEILEYGLMWVLGYGLIWISKWILTDVIYGRNLVEAGLKQVLYRTGANSSFIILAIAYNVIQIAVPIIITVGIINFIVIKHFKDFSKENFKKAIPFFIIAVMPFVWYAILSNHSVNHWFFVYRIQFLMLASLPIAVNIACGEKEK